MEIRLTPGELAALRMSAGEVPVGAWVRVRALEACGHLAAEPSRVPLSPAQAVVAAGPVLKRPLCASCEKFGPPKTRVCATCGAKASLMMAEAARYLGGLRLE